MDTRYVIVGGGVAAARAAEALRQGVGSGQGSITLISAEDRAPYERPPLSKEYLLGNKAADELYVLEPQWYEKNEVRLLLSTRVSQLDPAARTVTTDQGEQLGYDRLLLVTGADPVELHVPGVDLDGVLYLRRAEQSDRIQAAIRTGRPVVVIGGGWLGLELAAAARQSGCPTSLVETGPQPLAGQLGEEAGQRLSALHRAHGVSLHLGAEVEQVLGEQGAVSGVQLKDGTRIEAAYVLIAVGDRPSPELAEQAGLAVDGGVTVDRTLRTTDENIWAAGDVASMANDWVGQVLRVAHFAVASDSGAVAGANMAGGEQVWAEPPFFWSDQYDAGMEFRGWQPLAQGAPVIRELPDSDVWFAFYLDEQERVVAALHVNGWDDADEVKAMVEAKARVSRQALADPGTPLMAARA